MCKHTWIHDGSMYVCIFRPTAPHRARAPCLSPALLQSATDLLRVGLWWTELSNLTTFLLCLKWHNGSHAEAELCEMLFTLFFLLLLFLKLPCQLTWHFWKTNYYHIIVSQFVRWWRWDILPDIWPLTDIASMTIEWIRFLLIGHAAGVMTWSYRGVCVCVLMWVPVLYTLLLDLFTWQAFFFQAIWWQIGLKKTLLLHSCDSQALVRVRFNTSDEDERGPGHLAWPFSLSLSPSPDLRLDNKWSMIYLNPILLSCADSCTVWAVDTEVGSN